MADFEKKKSVRAIDFLSFGHLKLILVLVMFVGMLPSSSVEMAYGLPWGTSWEAVISSLLTRVSLDSLSLMAGSQLDSERQREG